MGWGKTPLAARLACLARMEGADPCIVLRGYGGKVSRKARRIPSPPPPGAARLYGDEAVLHAMETSVAVYVAADRYQGVSLAAEQGCSLAILDDGMQHRQIERDLEIVTLPAGSPFANGRLLPRGPLREPVKALRRADIVVLSHREERATIDSVKEEIRDLAPRAKVLSWRPRLRLKPLLEDTSLSEVPDRGVAVGLLCGIGRAGPFARAVQRLGYRIAWSELFPDHHPFTKGDLDGIARRMGREPVAAVVTTAKDAVRMDRSMGVDLRGFQIAELGLDWIEGEAEETLRAALRNLSGR